MTLFDGPEHASYIALMRELRLEREFEEGDWHCSIAGYVSPTLPGTPMLVTAVELRLTAMVGSENLADSVWLPRLDQWLAMLEEAVKSDEWLLYQEGLMPDGSGFKRYCAEFEHGTTKAASTPGEACARLWCAVTGREATGG